MAREEHEETIQKVAENQEEASSSQVVQVENKSQEIQDLQIDRNLKKNIVIETISVNYCKQCKAAFRAAPSEYGDHDDDDQEENVDNEDDLKSKRDQDTDQSDIDDDDDDLFCSQFCRDQSKISSREEKEKRKQKRIEDEINKINLEAGTGSRDDLLEEVEGKTEKDVDGGYAWIILAVMFIINASTYGTARAYGLIFEKMAREDDQGRTIAALPFNIMGALENLGGPMTGYLLSRSSWRVTVFVGSCLITLAHLLAAFSGSIVNRILTMGVMCGVGLSLVSISAFNINNAYFDKYRSRAFGFCLTGAAVGTFYISPSCEYVLEEYSVAHCYLLLAFILFPNVPLSLLLKPKNKLNQISDHNEIMTSCTIEPIEDALTEVKTRDDCQSENYKKQIDHKLDSSSNSNNSCQNDDGYEINLNQEKPLQQQETTKVYIISKKEKKQRDKKRRKKDKKNKESISLTSSIKQVISTPMFHLIWTTQLLFCWFNFVFGMIIVDFGKDRGLDDDQSTDLILIWAFGQLFGRLGLGFLVDIKLVSYRTFTIICFLFISLATWCMDKVVIENYEEYIIFSMVFTLSMFIAVLYILFNGLTVEYMDKSVSTFTVGISSFIGSFFLFPRANVIGYYRDSMGNYDAMLTLFQYVSLAGAIVWLVIPSIISKLASCFDYNSKSNETIKRSFKEAKDAAAAAVVAKEHVTLTMDVPKIITTHD